MLTLVLLLASWAMQGFYTNRPPNMLTLTDDLPVFLVSQVGSELLLCLNYFLFQEFWYLCKNDMLIQRKERKQECRCVGRARVLLWVAEQI